MAIGSKISTGYNEFLPLNGLSSGAPSGSNVTAGLRGLYDPEVVIESGSRTLALPTDPSFHKTSGGAMVRAFFDDYYNRIHVIPPFIDFGSVTLESPVPTRIWNSYYRQGVTLTSISFDPQIGLAVTGLEPPAGFLPLQQRNYEVTALLEGPATFDSGVVWSFDIPWSFTQSVRGLRARLWPFAPNWGGGDYTMEYAFKTEVITSRSGREQRIALRTTPRRTLSNKVLLRREQLVSFNDQMRQWQHLTYLMPELTRYAVSVGPMIVDSNSMEFGVAPDWAVAERQVILDYQGNREPRQIEGVIGSTVFFKTVSSTEWPAGTKMIFGLVGYMDTSLSAPRDTNYHAQLDLRFNVTPLSDQYVEPPAAAVTLGGREVFLTRPNWANRVGATIAHEVDEIDYDRGPVTRFTPIYFSTETRSLTFTGRGVADMEAIRDFFYRMHGRQGEFLMPSWEYDFKPKIAADAVSANLRIAGLDFAKIYGTSTVYKSMFVLLTTGEVLLRKVVSVLPIIDGDGSDSFMTVEGAWGKTISVDTIVMCGWMPVWRFASDNLTINWLTDKIGQCQITVQSLEDLPVETP